ncbi:hypothetical protein BXZ70DRAFT_598233 [Cristinia sonorae]|uniref:Secreted protein n=1 Tax=Cristinia sonorae TaxID=1940300 RepID=A0A8K0UUD2_9AGAR|nr:hypothetical protein BXZ70DRAFT_598233 [Cristinia sonorae]
MRASWKGRLWTIGILQLLENCSLLSASSASNDKTVQEVAYLTIHHTILGLSRSAVRPRRSCPFSNYDISPYYTTRDSYRAKISHSLRRTAKHSVRMGSQPPLALCTEDWIGINNPIAMHAQSGQ